MHVELIDRVASDQSDGREMVRSRVSVDPDVDLPAVQPVAVHGTAGALSGLRVVEADHATALGLPVLHLDVGVLDDPYTRTQTAMIRKVEHVYTAVTCSLRSFQPSERNDRSN